MKRTIELVSLKAKIFLSFYETFVNGNQKIFILVDNKILNNDFLKQYENPSGIVTLNVSQESVVVESLNDEYFTFNSTFNEVLKHLEISMVSISAVLIPIDGKESSIFVLPTEKHFHLDNKKICIEKTPKVKDKKLSIVKENKTQENKVVDFSAARKKKEENRDM